jgi:hypothetical protein
MHFSRCSNCCLWSGSSSFYTCSEESNIPIEIGVCSEVSTEIRCSQEDLSVSNSTNIECFIQFFQKYMYLHIIDVSLYVVDCDSRISHNVLFNLQHGPQGSHCRVHKHSFFAVRTWIPRVFLT